MSLSSADDKNVDHVQNLSTEARNPASTNIDKLTTDELCRIINDEDATVATAVRACIPNIAAAIDSLASRVRQGGRVVYVGAGTSGRLGVLDAAEIPPTYSAPAGQFIGVIAGGDGAVREAREGAEDSWEAAVSDLQALRLDGGIDSVVGIASSGRTPYVLSSLAFAKALGCVTVGIACTVHSAMSRSGKVDFMIEAVTGAEVVTGSTRMKAGTATKLVLNTLSTGVMIKCGKTYGNVMVDVRPTNVKLQFRARRILREIVTEASSKSDDELDATLLACGKSVKTAAVALSLGISVEEADSKLDEANGVLANLLKPSESNPNGVVADTTLSDDEFVLCVDGGGSKCSAVMISKSGKEGMGEAGPCNIADVGATAAIAEIQLAISRAMARFSPVREISLSSLKFRKVWIGLAGGDRKDASSRVAQKTSTILNLQTPTSLRVTNDLELLATVFGSKESVKDVVVLVAGTGSIAVHYRQQSGGVMKVARTGGWGALIGDDGSGFDIGRQALRYTLGQLDNRTLPSESRSAEEKPDTLVNAILDHYRPTADQKDDYDLLSSVLLSATGSAQTASEAKRKIASSAPVVIQSTGSSRQAASIVDSAQASVICLLRSLTSKSGFASMETALILAGGLMRSEEFQADLYKRMATNGLNFRCVRHIAQPALEGAQFMAQQEFVDPG